MMNARMIYFKTLPVVVSCTAASGLLTGILVNSVDGVSFVLNEIGKEPSVEPTPKNYSRYIAGEQLMKARLQSIASKNCKSCEDEFLKGMYRNAFIRLVAYTALGVVTGVAYPITFPICMFLIL